MRKYELMMIVDPTLSDADRTALLSEVKQELATHKAKILTEDLIGEKTLAYKIRASATGYYVLCTLESAGAGFVEFSGFLNLKKPVWRYMFTRIDE